MYSIVSTRAGPELRQRWRQQIAGQRRRRQVRGPRPYAAISYFARGPVNDGLIDMRRLLFVVLREAQHLDQSVSTHFAGYTSAAIPCGVQIGGVEGCRFQKELMLVPKHGGRGCCFNLDDQELLTRALELDRFLERQQRYPHLPRRRQPRLPQLWAAFTPDIAAQIHGAGPEFEMFCRTGAPIARRSLAGMTLFPLELVSHAWRQFRTVFADLKTIPKRQVVAVDDPARNLCGFSGAIQYDLYHSRFATHVV